jgi:hypothetical protein
MATPAWSTAEVMTEAEVIGLMGRARFERLKELRMISPFRRGFARDMYPRAYVRMRYEEDLRIYPDGATATYDARNGQWTITKALARSGAGYTVAVDGRHRITANNGRGTSPTATHVPGWHTCLFCRGSGSCANCGGLGVVAGDVTCQVCGGGGDCPDCGGKGRAWGRPLSPQVARAWDRLRATIARKTGMRL